MSRDGAAEDEVVGPGALVRPYLAAADRLPDPTVPPDPPPTVAPALRPYLQTAGRVRADDGDLEIEAQVVTTASGHIGLTELAFEQRDIVALCDTPQSLAEVSALLGLQIGVARVLVGDLAARGYLEVSRPRPGAAHDAATIERVIRGLQAIS